MVTIKPKFSFGWRRFEDRVLTCFPRFLDKESVENFYVLEPSESWLDGEGEF